MPPGICTCNTCTTSLTCSQTGRPWTLARENCFPIPVISYVCASIMGGFFTMLFDFKEIPAKECYKLLVSTVTPRPIAWVVSQDSKGLLNAAPFSFFNVFSGDPAVVAIGIGNRKPGQAKDSRANIRETGEFVVNLVGESNAEAMNITGIEFDSSV